MMHLQPFVIFLFLIFLVTSLLAQWREELKVISAVEEEASKPLSVWKVVQQSRRVNWRLSYVASSLAVVMMAAQGVWTEPEWSQFLAKTFTLALLCFLIFSALLAFRALQLEDPFEFALRAHLGLGANGSAKS